MNKRCKTIKDRLETSSVPITASSLAAELSVSRQVIVGDVAILRAAGCDIIATSRGYVMNAGESASAFPYTGIIACRHSAEQIKEELYTIVDFGGTIIDVSIEHAIYGELCAKMGISSRYDVDMFIQKVDEEKNSAPISSLTGGLHLHRIGCADEEIFVRIKDELEQKGILIK